jgi:hypothetical protein
MGITGHARVTPSRSTDPFAEDPFAYRVTKDGRVLIERRRRTVSVVAGKDGLTLASKLALTLASKLALTLASKLALTLASKLALADADGVQQLLARATGNYRRGTER